MKKRSWILERDPKAEFHGYWESNSHTIFKWKQKRVERGEPRPDKLYIEVRELERTRRMSISIGFNINHWWIGFRVNRIRVWSPPGNFMITIGLLFLYIGISFETDITGDSHIEPIEREGSL